MSYIFATGCSWTQEDFKSEMHLDYDTSYPKWPELVAKHFNVDYVNKGKGGGDLTYGFYSILNAITSDNPPDAVIWQLTQWFRVPFNNRAILLGSFCEGVELPGFSFFSLKPWLFCLSVATLLKGETNQFVDKALLYIDSIRLFCKKLDIPLFIFTSDLHPLFNKYFSYYYFKYLREIKFLSPEIWKMLMTYFNSESEYFDRLDYHQKYYKNENYLGEFIKHPTFKKIESTDYEIDMYGWPFFDQLGGKIIGHNGNVISKTDGHPNKKGQEEIAKGVIRELEYRKWSFKGQ